MAQLYLIALAPSKIHLSHQSDESERAFSIRMYVVYPCNKQPYLQHTTTPRTVITHETSDLAFELKLMTHLKTQTHFFVEFP